MDHDELMIGEANNKDNPIGVNEILIGSDIPEDSFAGAQPDDPNTCGLCDQPKPSMTYVEACGEFFCITCLPHLSLE